MNHCRWTYKIWYCGRP